MNPRLAAVGHAAAVKLVSQVPRLLVAAPAFELADVSRKVGGRCVRQIGTLHRERASAGASRFFADSLTASSALRSAEASMSATDCDSNVSRMPCWIADPP